jgi:hypothetical protein
VHVKEHLKPLKIDLTVDLQKNTTLLYLNNAPHSRSKDIVGNK